MFGFREDAPIGAVELAARNRRVEALGWPVKLRDLTYEGRAAWPPLWTAPVEAPDNVHDEDRILVGMREAGVQGAVVLEVSHEDHPYVGVLLWEPPPPVERVVEILRASIGRRLGDFHDRDL